ncbi:hydrogenase 1 b-type cytochrome subunit, partial [Escherichia coli]|nr:hydrogenase 1 b-type cytochrome subunit [Escherichia coli]
HRLGMWLIGAFVIVDIYMAVHEDIMSVDTVISTMVSCYRSHKFGKISNKERT